MDVYLTDKITHSLEPSLLCVFGDNKITNTVCVPSVTEDLIKGQH